MATTLRLSWPLTWCGYRSWKLWVPRGSHILLGVMPSFPVTPEVHALKPRDFIYLRKWPSFGVRVLFKCNLSGWSHSSIFYASDPTWPAFLWNREARTQPHTGKASWEDDSTDTDTMRSHWELPGRCRETFHTAPRRSQPCSIFTSFFQLQEQETMHFLPGLC